MMFCKYCGKEIPDDSVFCPACGKKLLIVCDSCGTILPEGSAFCLKCGKKIVSEQPASFVNVPPMSSREDSKQVAAEQPKPKKHKFYIIPIILIIVALCATGIFIYLQNTNQQQAAENSNASQELVSTSTETTPSPEPTAKQLVAKKKPVSGTLFTVPDFERPCHLYLTAPDDADVIVYMEYVGEPFGTEKTRAAKSYAKQPYVDDVSFYIHAGESSNIQVPIGSYKIYYAIGDTYYGTDALFGDETIYCQIKNELPFIYQKDTGYTTYDLDLSMLSPNTIESSKFPSL